MGVDCRITLPSRARIRDVADVVAILLGAECVKESLSHGGSYHANVKGVAIKGSDAVAECATITYADRWFLYHFEFGHIGERGIMPSSTAKNIAMLKRVADFFGGRVDFNDCDSSECDYFVEEQPDINASDGEPWHRLQDKKLALLPLSISEIQACERFAAYKQAA